MPIGENHGLSLYPIARGYGGTENTDGYYYIECIAEIEWKEMARCIYRFYSLSFYDIDQGVVQSCYDPTVIERRSYLFILFIVDVETNLADINSAKMLVLYGIACFNCNYY